MILAPNTSLRPLSLGEILDQSIRLYRKNFLKFIGILALVQIPLALAQLFLSDVTLAKLLEPLTQPTLETPRSYPTYFASLGAALLLGILNIFLVQGIASAALTRAIANDRLGEPLGILEAYRKIGPSWQKLVGALFLIMILGVGLFVCMLIPCVGWISGPGMLAFFAAGVAPFVTPIILLEKKGVFQSMRRAWDLARRRFWWLIGFVFILILFNQVVVTGPAALISGAMAFLIGKSANSANLTILQTVVSSITGLLLSLIYTPLRLSAITLVYLDLRARTEGFDLLLQTSPQSTSPGGDITLLTSQAPFPETGNLITIRELGYFVALSVAAGMLYVLLIGFIGGLYPFLFYALQGNL